jgi:hypothetical protein
VLFELRWSINIFPSSLRVTFIMPKKSHGL